MEGVATAITLELICGIFRPGVAVVAGLVYIIGRVFYALGYRHRGAKGRMIGALLIDAALVTLLIYTFSSLWTVGGGVDGFILLLLQTGEQYGIHF